MSSSESEAPCPRTVLCQDAERRCFLKGGAWVQDFADRGHPQFIAKHKKTPRDPSTTTAQLCGGAYGYITIEPRYTRIQRIDENSLTLTLRYDTQAVTSQALVSMMTSNAKALLNLVVPVIFVTEGCRKTAKCIKEEEDIFLGLFQITHVSVSEKLTLQLTWFGHGNASLNIARDHVWPCLATLTPQERTEGVEVENGVTSAVAVPPAAKRQRVVRQDILVPADENFATSGRQAKLLWQGAIWKARTTIDVMVYCLTCPVILQDLVNARMRGVNVRVIVDAPQQGSVHQMPASSRALLDKLEPWYLTLSNGVTDLKIHTKLLLVDADEETGCFIQGSYNPSTVACSQLEIASKELCSHKLKACKELFTRVWSHCERKQPAHMQSAPGQSQEQR